MHNRNKHNHIEDPAKRKEPTTGHDGRVSICGKDEGYLTYFPEDIKQVGCSQCLNLHDLEAYQELVKTSDPRFILGKQEDQGGFKEFRSSAPILDTHNDEAVVGYVRSPAGWGKAEWQVWNISVWNTGSWRDPGDPICRPVLGKGEFRSKWAALIWVQTQNEVALRTEEEAWEKHRVDEEERVANQKKREAAEAVERAEYDGYVKELEAISKFDGLDDAHRGALKVAIKLVKERRELI